MRNYFIVILAFLYAPLAHANSLFITDEVNEQYKDIVERVEFYLSDIKSFKAEFTQSAPDGSINTGTFFMKRPGLMRWQYAPPSPILMVSDGYTLTFFDKELEQVSYVSLDNTMLGFLAEDEIRFSGAVSMTNIEQENNVVRITVAQKDNPDEGRLTFELTEKPMRLAKIVVQDATHQETHIGFYNAQFNIELDDEIFEFKDPRKKGRILNQR